MAVGGVLLYRPAGGHILSKPPLAALGVGLVGGHFVCWLVPGLELASSSIGTTVRTCAGEWTTPIVYDQLSDR